MVKIMMFNGKIHYFYFYGDFRLNCQRVNVQMFITSRNELGDIISKKLLKEISEGDVKEIPTSWDIYQPLWIFFFFWKLMEMG